MKVILLNRQKKIDIDTSLFKKIASYAANKFNADKNAELNIIFVEKEEISILNMKYRGINDPTDVLSFSYKNFMDMEKTREFLTDEVINKNFGFYVVGEIIISPEIAKENIENKNTRDKDGWNLKKEIALLIIHGILHVYDYDHEKKEDSVNMENIQSSLLNDVFSNFIF